MTANCQKRMRWKLTSGCLREWVGFMNHCTASLPMNIVSLLQCSSNYSNLFQIREERDGNKWKLHSWFNYKDNDIRLFSTHTDTPPNMERKSSVSNDSFCLVSKSKWYLLPLLVISKRVKPASRNRRISALLPPRGYHCPPIEISTDSLNGYVTVPRKRAQEWRLSMMFVAT